MPRETGNPRPSGRGGCQCRWSTDDFGCDLYVYEGLFGWSINVASLRYVFADPLPAPVALPAGFTDKQFEAWAGRVAVVSDIIHRSDLAPIGLSSDGQSLEAATPGQAADVLETLAQEGYRFPRMVVDELRAEQAEMDSSTPLEGVHGFEA